MRYLASLLLLLFVHFRVLDICICYRKQQATALDAQAPAQWVHDELERKKREKEPAAIQRHEQMVQEMWNWPRAQF
jgi:hypothetical protein